MGTAFLFAGQGSQAVGMFDALRGWSGGSELIDDADAALGFSLSRIVAEGPVEALRRTAIAQPALLAISVAHARRLTALGLRPEALAGHSLGQTSALVVAGALSFEDAVRLVHQRGRMMQEAAPEGQGAMMAIVGLDLEVVEAACAAARPLGVVAVACHNAPRQIVISGRREAVAAAADRCDEEGGGVVELAVSAPFHCELLAPMIPAFGRVVDAVPMADPALPVIDNATAQPLPDAAAARRSLVEQIVAPVLFEESLQYLVGMGIDRFVQCGPGDSLLAFARRVSRRAELLTFDAAALDATG